MGYFRAVEAVSRPYSFPVVPTESFERGSFLWMNSSAQATTVLSGNVPLGIADDNFVSGDTTGRIIDQEIIVPVTVSVTTGSATYSLGRTLPTVHTLSSTIPAEWTVEVETAVGSGVYAALGTASFANSGTDTVLQAGIAVDGTVTVQTDSSGSGFTAGAYNVKLTLSYVYNVQVSGSSVVSDMFNNNSTEASGLTTVWFLDGIYETDQYDPYVALAYTVGGIAYAATGGQLTTTVGTTKVGWILAVPQANYTAETRTVNGHSKPKPESLRVLARMPQA